MRVSHLLKTSLDFNLQDVDELLQWNGLRSEKCLEPWWCYCVFVALIYTVDLSQIRGAPLYSALSPARLSSLPLLFSLCLCVLKALVTHSPKPLKANWILNYASAIQNLMNCFDLWISI
nr:hypothetical protein Iba_chr12cCG18250 [Ipomoea batatas]